MITILYNTQGRVVVEEWACWWMSDIGYEVGGSKVTRTKCVDREVGAARVNK